MVEQIGRENSARKPVKEAKLSATSKCEEKDKTLSITKLPSKKTSEDQEAQETKAMRSQTSEHPHMEKQLSAPANISSNKSDHSNSLKTDKQQGKILSSDNQTHEKLGDTKTPDKPDNILISDKLGDNLTLDKPVDNLTPYKPGNNLTPDKPVDNLTPDKPGDNLTPKRPGNHLTHGKPGDNQTLDYLGNAQKAGPCNHLLESERPEDENLPVNQTAIEDTMQVPTQSRVNNETNQSLDFKEMKSCAHDKTVTNGANDKGTDRDNQEDKEKLLKDNKDKTGRGEHNIPEGLDRKERKYSLNHPPPSAPPPPVTFHVE